MTEIWRPVIGYEVLYAVSNLGQVKRIALTTKISPEDAQSIYAWREQGLSLHAIAQRLHVSDGAIQKALRKRHRQRRPLTGILKIRIDSKGYPFVSLSKEGQVKQFRIHTLVVTSFICPMPPKGQVNHLNGIRQDNRLENLEITDNRGNALHRFHVLNKQTPHRGSIHYRAKLHERDIPVIRDMLARYVPYWRIAEQFGVTPRTIGQIKDGTTWTHVP